MNGNLIPRIIAILVCLVMALWVTLDLFTSGSNVVARLYGYITLATGIVGLLAPRGAFYLVILMTAYLDFFKRFMILDSNVSRMDLYLVMGMGPVTTAGIAVNLLYRAAIGQIKLGAGIPRLMLLVVTGMVVLTGMSFVGGAGFRAVGDAVNSTVYLALIFIVPILFPTPGDLKLLIKRTLIIYVPAVAYMLVHFYRAAFMDLNPPIFGWELDYVRSGLTIEIRQLAERRFRPFGTMNNAANASIVFGSFIVMLCSPMWRFSGVNPLTKAGWKPIRFLWIPFVAVAAYATFSRAGWVVGAAGVAAALMFRSRFRTVSFYALSFIQIVMLFIFAGYIRKHEILNDISKDIFEQRGTDSWAQATNISTFNDRLKGFEVWSEPKAWTPVGLWIKGEEGRKIRQELWAHDALTSMLLKVGYIGMTLLLVGGIWLLKQLHGYTFRQAKGLAKYMAVSCLSAVILILATGLANSEVFTSFPVNFFISFYLAVPVALIMHEKKEAQEERLEIAVEREAAKLSGPQPAQSGRPGRTMPVPARA